MLCRFSKEPFCPAIIICEVAKLKLAIRLPASLTGLPEAPSAYFLRHVWLTTSGMFSVPPVLCAISVFGVDRVLFSVDYPFGPNAAGRALLDTLPLSRADVAKIAAGNAERVLRLGP